MTQIKLRRDTSANFTSKNPVLGIGEPAYETDTKKLKIGDGTTAYTQLAYFSSGGGSSDITATLPIKIVDGVISLEVDGQTIQIVDGKLHANLDELGNEVNDLSGRVTAAEADLMNKASKAELAAKQDKLSPIAPLGINQTTISNVTDGTFLADASVILNSAFYVNYTTDADARFLIYANNTSNVGATPTSFIQIPFALGDLISFPFERDNDSDIGLVFGYWKEDLFYPTMLYKTHYTYGSGSNQYAPFAFVREAGKSSLEKIATYYGPSSAISKSTLTYNSSMSLNATNYIQVTKNAGVPTVNMWFTTAGASYPNAGYTQRMSTSDTTVLENFNKTNVCLLLSNDTSKAINLTKVTRRELGDTVLDPTADALTTALSTYSNSFDAAAKVTTNDLSLALGDGLSVVDGKLTNTNPTKYVLPVASTTTVGGVKIGDNLSVTEDGTLSAVGGGSSAPENMVTTDTTQTITGAKEFTGITTISNDIKLTNGKKITTKDGQWLMQLGTGFIGIGTSVRPLTTYDSSNYYLHNESVIAGDGIKITEPSSGKIQISSTIGNMAAYVTEEYINGTEGYRVWSNGRCEQWGYHINSHTDITLLKTMKNNTYFVTGIALQYGVLTLKSQTTTSIQIWIGNNPSTEESFYWYLSGELGS